MGLIIGLVVAAVVGGLCWYFLLPTLGFTLFWCIYALIVLIIIAVAKTDGFIDGGVLWGMGIALGVIALVVCMFASAPLTRHKTYHNLVSLKTHEEEALEDTLPSIEEIKSVSLMDTNSSRKLGDRTLGGLVELVSQYNVGEYYTICINGEVKKIACLEYAGFFKYLKRKTIPGYVIVDPLTSEAEYIPLETPIQYAPTACFSKDIERHIASAYPTEYRGDLSFQVDDDGVPYWIMTLEKAHALWYARSPYAAVLCNAQTGEMTKYLLEEIPEWVDLVYSGKTVSRLYNHYGNYINGFWNFSDTGKTNVTDDFGYIIKDDDVYIYTGVTSVAQDESNIGVLLVNTRTGVFDFYEVPGAEEYSAMDAASGVVQNYGYKASFPSLIMYDSIPTYVMVLKDSNGLVKQYGMVNYKNYTIAVVDDTLQGCINKYTKALAASGTSADLERVTGVVGIAGETIEDVYVVVLDGNTLVYITTEDREIYRAQFDETLLQYRYGDRVDIKYAANDTTGIKDIVEISLQEE